MSITLSKLCANTEKTYNMKLIAGKSGMDNYVRWVHMVEDRQVPDFLQGNELVFTTGIGQYNTSWLVDFVKSLREHNAAGLVVNLGPYISSIPSKAISYCEEYGFPLFTIPWAVHLIDVTYDFCHRIVSSEENEVSLAAAFRNLIFTPKDRDSYVPVLERWGFHNESDYIIMMAKMNTGYINGSENWKNLRFVIRRVLGKSVYPVCIFIQEEFLVVIRQKCTVYEVEELAAQLCDGIYKQLPEIELRIGISDPGAGYMGIPICYKKAMSAMQVADRRDRVCMRYSDIGVYKLLFGVEDVQILRDYFSDVLGVLLEYDRKNDTDYVKTLYSYLLNSGSVIEVANALNVHRNTVNYKMKMIREILGMELNDEDKMNLMLAFHVRNLLNI